MKKFFLLAILAAFVAMISFAAAEKSGGREVIFRWTDRNKSPKLQFVGSWYFQHESAYTTKYQGNRDAKGKAICKPGLTGKFEVFASFRATENRGTAAKYMVDGKLVRTENQRSLDGGGKHAQKFPELSLGIFELNADSVVMMNAADGQSYSFTGFRFKPSDGTPSVAADTDAGGNTTFGDLISAEAPEGAVKLTNQNQGTEEYTVKASGEITVDAMLSTYGPAEMWIKDQADKELLSWKRADDKDPAQLMVDGKAVEASNVEVAPGDYTPSAQKVKIKVEAGQVLKIHLSGDFGNAQSYLVINE